MARVPVADDLSGSNYLKSAGTFHFVCTAFDDPVMDRNGALVNDAVFRIHVEVLAGTVGQQEGKITELTFRWSTNDKDGGEFRKKIMSRFLLAIGKITEQDKGKDVDVIESDVLGRQFIAKVDLSEKGYINLDADNVWHVDDPAAKQYPKSAEALKMIHPNLRMIGNRAKSTAKPAANGVAAPQKQPAAAGSVPQDIESLDI